MFAGLISIGLPKPKRRKRSMNVNGCELDDEEVMKKEMERARIDLERLS